MPTFSFDVYQQTGNELKANNPTRYITPELFLVPNNPLVGMLSTSGITNFFGTKTLNLLVVGHPYGWARNDDGDLEDRWDDLDLQPAIDHHKAMFDYWARYETRVWIDYLFVKEVEAREGESRAREMMDAVAGHMEELCTELADYGWIFMGPIEDTVNMSADFFQPYVDDFMAS